LKKFELTLASLGVRFAIQHERELTRLHTFLPGDRCELDYSKYGVFLRPNMAWDEPVIFQVGLGVDHSSGVIKGYTVTAQPTAISSVRLYKNCVLPPRLWLRKELAEQYADKFDVCGIDRVVAVDNARDLRANVMARLFMLLGIIMLVVPPKRGDLKGKVERTILSLEQMFMQALPGYCPNVYRFTDPRNRWLRDKARKNARLTVAAFEELLLAAIVAYNWQDHPDFKKPRIIVYREGLASAPPLLPVGQMQMDSMFAMTYESKVTREGVKAETWHYNSSELQQFCRVDGPSAKVCIPVDDVRTAIVFHEELVEPLRVPITTHRFDGPTPLEYARLVLSGNQDEASRVAWDAEGQSALDDVLNRMVELQQSGRRRPDAPAHLATTAASQAPHVPPVEPPRPRAVNDKDLADIFNEEA
jgi:hypothetical protein